MRPLLRWTPPLRSLAARLLLGVLLLGSASHLWHHLSDPTCGVAEGRGGQPCATCAGLHGSATASQPENLSAPTAITLATISFAEIARPIAPVIPGGAPRAPPAGC